MQKYNIATFVAENKKELLSSVAKTQKPVYAGNCDNVSSVLAELKRKPFEAQERIIQGVQQLFEQERCATINAEMGTGKTIMAIAEAYVRYRLNGDKRFLIISPPHLVYKWRREILDTVPNASVWVLNGADTLAKLIQLRDGLLPQGDSPEFFIIGRVRMRMGFHWKPLLSKGSLARDNGKLIKGAFHRCPNCYTAITDRDGQVISASALATELPHLTKRSNCRGCNEPLWELVRPRPKESRNNQVEKVLVQLPTIGKQRAEQLLNQFGDGLLSDVLADNLYQFVNLMDKSGNFVFTDQQAQRIEKALARMEFGLGEGYYQPSEFIKRQLPDKYFDMLIVDEGHEYKNYGTAQGEAMGVLANKVRKVLLLTGTLMGGYADDLFFLFYRVNAGQMKRDGFAYKNGSLLPSAAEFMMRYGVLETTIKHTEYHESSLKTAKGKSRTKSLKKKPGFSPLGVVKYVLPNTLFLKLKEIDPDVLPSYDEEYIEVSMSEEQSNLYKGMSQHLRELLKESLRKGDHSLLGVVLNALLRWPETCYQAEMINHPHTNDVLISLPSIHSDITPKERRLLDLVRSEKDSGRKVLVYTTYTGTFDTATRLKELLTEDGIKVAALRSSVSTQKREEWIDAQLEKGIDVLVCNPELVKTGLDLLAFPTIVFMQTGWNVYTLQQAARRSWRIGQKASVKVYFLGYSESAQSDCLDLMSQKIAVSQSTSGDIPDSGLDVLNQAGDSVEVALAKRLLNQNSRADRFDKTDSVKKDVLDADAIRQSLAHCTGTTKWYRYTNDILLTDGSKELADSAKAYWLLDIIASYQGSKKLEKIGWFQTWNLSQNGATSWCITCDNGNGKVFVKQEIEHSDFPLEEGVKLYCIEDESNKVVLLPSEY